MRYDNSRRRRRSSNLGIVPILLFVIILVGSIGAVIYAQSSVINAKKEYNLLIEKINETEKENVDLEKNTSKINKAVAEKKEEYDDMRSKAKIAYLTFDDGPSSNTKAILDILDEHNIKATFFVNGHPGLEPLYKEIHDRGHVIANHTYSHDYSYVYASEENFKADVKKLEDFIEKATGEKPAKILRFPGGSNNQVSWQYSGRSFMKKLVKDMTEEGYTFFDWNLDSTDASAYRQKESRIISSILDNAKYVRKANVLMHDLGPKTTTVDALPAVIKGLEEQGFIFDSLNENSYKAQFTKID